MRTTNTPKNIQKNGNKGANGSDGRTCKTTAKKVNVNSLWHQYLAAVVPMYTINSDFTSNDRDDPNCPAKYVRTSEAAQPQNSIKRLKASLATSEYKKFLLQNLENPALATMVKKANDAIESVA